MAEISRADVEHVALLARLQLEEAELERVRKEMNRILEAFAELRQLDTADVSPTSHAQALTNVIRPDEARASLSVEEALSNAPDRASDQFRVPLIIEED